MSAPTLTGLAESTGQITFTLLSASSREDGGKDHSVEWPELLEGGKRPAGWKRGGRFHVALPAGEALISVTDLPSTDPEELDGMVQLQAEEMSPFPMDRTEVGWEVLTRTDAGSTVLMALSSEQALESLRDRYASADILPDRVDLDVLAWLEVLRLENRLPSSDDTALLILLREAALFVVLAGEQPCMIRSLGAWADLSEEEWKEELQGAMLALEAERPGTSVRHLMVWHSAEAPSWQELLPGVSIQFENLETLPPPSRGVAERGRNGAVLDLSPPHWREEKANRETRRRRVRLLGGVAACWLLALLALILGVQWKAAELQRLTRQRNQQEAGANEVRLLEEQVRSLSQFTDRSSSALEMLQLLAASMPSNGVLEIEDFRYTKEEGIVFSGEAPGGTQPFYTFLETLGQSEVLRVEQYDVTQQRGTTRFDVTARWRWIEESQEDGA